jgi:hypothetical protein
MVIVLLNGQIRAFFSLESLNRLSAVYILSFPWTCRHQVCQIISPALDPTSEEFGSNSSHDPGRGAVIISLDYKAVR